MRLLLRFVGLLSLAGAFVALIVDGTRSIAADHVTLLPLGRTIAAVSPQAFIKLHTSLETHAPALWDPVVVTMLLLPTWCVLGVFGLLMLALTRPPQPKIGYSRR